MTQACFANPFREEGSWFKGNLHTHTTLSDGLLSPEEVASLYEEMGYDFLFITDHGKVVDAEELNEILPRDFRVVPGVELGCGRSEVNTGYHIVALNLGHTIESHDPQTVIDEIVRQGGEAVIAHPYWSALTVNDLLRLDGYLGIEIFNTICHFAVAKGYSTAHWDNLLDRERYTLGFAVDDAHHCRPKPYRPLDAGYAWVRVKARSLRTEDIMDALRSGLFYSSNEPEIFDVEVTAESIIVKSSPARAVSFITKNGLGERFTALGEPIVESRYEIRGTEKYLRIEVENDKGRIAWTNPIIFNQE
jgi:predicted metal-dependent phosphoesterase TrpH